MDVNLTFFQDVEYIGEIYLGAPNSQKAFVTFDTGSRWLNVKSCIYQHRCHKHDFESKPQKDWPRSFKKYKKDILKNENHTGVVYHMNSTKSG